jgi:putative ABC transport system permease protein
MSLILIAAGAPLGWYKLLGVSRRRPLNRVWFTVALVVAVALSFLPASATQNLGTTWLFAVVAGGYARAVHVTGRMDVWRRAPDEADSADESDCTDGTSHDVPTGGERWTSRSVSRQSEPLARERSAGYGDTPRSPARRAMVRWAWRLFRREWRQHLIVLSLITVAVAGTVVGAAVATDASAPTSSGIGTANRLVQLVGSDPRLSTQVAALHSRFGDTDVIEDQNINTGLAQGAELRAQDPRGPYGGSMLSLVSGRYPAAAGQVAVSDTLAAVLDLKVGEVWNDSGHALTVVGMVENPQNLADTFALVPPGQLGPSAPLGSADTVTVLFDASAAQLAAEPLPDGLTAQSPAAASGISPAVIVLAVAVLALTFTGLVAVAGFAALARRRQRALGMLAALGATERDIELVVIADGAIVGTIGAVVGALLGLGAWIAYAPRFSRSAGHVVNWTDIPWWIIACAILLAIACATLAAWRPAHAIARMPIVAALSDRPAPAVAAYRSATPALVLLIVAPVLLVTSGGWGGRGGRDVLFQLGGLLLSAFGLALAAPFAVARLAGPARRVPPAARLALRDLARYRVRSAAALAAGSLAVLIAMLVTLITTGRYSDPVDYFGPNLSSQELVIYAPGDGPGTGRGPNGGVPQSTATLEQHADAIASMLDSSNVLALDPVEADLMHRTSQKNTGDSGSLYVATPTVLAHYGIDPSSISPTTMLITSRSGLEGLSGLYLLYGDFANPNAPINSMQNPAIQTYSALPTGTEEPNLLVTEYAVRTLKLTVEPTSGWLIQAPRPLTAVQANAAREMALAAGMTIDTRSEAPSLAQVRDDATVTGILIALGVLAMMVGLIRAESAGDLRILTATGAGSRTRRGITATTAGVLALLAAIGGAAVAYLDTAAFFGSEFIQRLSEVPTTDLLLVLVALPVTAALGGWLFSGRELARIARVRIE